MKKNKILETSFTCKNVDKYGPKHTFTFELQQAIHAQWTNKFYYWTRHLWT